MRSKLLSAAISYARRGWAVFPLTPKGKQPISGTSGHRDATTDIRVIKAWWDEWPDANIGIRCDSVNGPVVLDIDGPEGKISLEHLDLPKTLKATSRRKHRRHYYFSGTESGEVLTRAIKILPGIDLLADGGYVIAPPSIHPKTQKSYRWINDREPAPVPSSILELIEARNTRGQRAAKLPLVIGKGERDDLLTSLAGSMRRRGASQEAILAALREENEHRCDPPLPDKQLEKIARSIAKKNPVRRSENKTDLGNARRFIRDHEEDVRYVRPWKQSWLVWDGTKWSPDSLGEAERLAKDTVRGIYTEAESIEDEKAQEEMFKHATKSESASRVKAMLELASTEPEISMSSELFDSDPWLFNVENGIIDLRTGRLTPHDRNALLTKQATVEYDPRATAPTWNRFLKDITNGRKSLVRYLQRIVGYSLTGVTREQCLFFCYGTGQNGKSTFLEMIREVMGDYSQQADFTTFLQKRGDGPRNDLARMRGMRFVAAIEAAGHKPFDGAVLKQLTGGDTITARRLYEEFFEFQPTHKLFLAANHKPPVSEQTEAFWRRIRMIPFTVFIPPNKRDLSLKEKLRDELPGILNWAIEGCLEWQHQGLAEPSLIKKATQSYRSEEDLIGEFIDIYCEYHEKAWTSSSDLYTGFTTWFRETRGAHVKVPSPRWFSRTLGERPMIRLTKRRGKRGWKGIALKMRLQ